MARRVLFCSWASQSPPVYIRDWLTRELTKINAHCIRRNLWPVYTDSWIMEFTDISRGIYRNGSLLHPRETEEIFFFFFLAWFSLEDLPLNIEELKRDRTFFSFNNFLSNYFSPNYWIIFIKIFFFAQNFLLVEFFQLDYKWFLIIILIIENDRDWWCGWWW